MGQRILDERFDEAIICHDENTSKKKSEGHWFGLIVDGWESVDKSYVEGVMLKAGQEISS